MIYPLGARTVRSEGTCQEATLWHANLRLMGRMQNSFHGRTFGAMALTTSKTYYRQGFAPLMPQVVVAPYPYCLHCKVRAAHPEGDSWYKVSLTARPHPESEAGCYQARCTGHI